MVIRCPHCQFSRSITLDKIPATAEIATCPKCKQRFRFRTIPKKNDPEPYENSSANEQPYETPQEEHPRDYRQKQSVEYSDGFSAETTQTRRPLPAKKQSSKKDIWDALSSFGKLWEKEKATEPVQTAHEDLADREITAQPSPEPTEESRSFHVRQDMHHADPSESASGVYAQDMEDETITSGWQQKVPGPPPIEEESLPLEETSPANTLRSEEDVEVYIHYVDGKPTSFRNPWAKKNSPEDETRPADNAPDSPDTPDTPENLPSKAQDHIGHAQPLHKGTSTNQDFEDVTSSAPPFSPTQTRVWQEDHENRGQQLYGSITQKGAPPQAGDSQELAHDQHDTKDKRPTSFEYQDQPDFGEREHPEQGQYEGIGKTDESTRPLTPLETLAAEGSSKGGSFDPAGDSPRGTLEWTEAPLEAESGEKDGSPSQGPDQPEDSKAPLAGQISSGENHLQQTTVAEKSVPASAEEQAATATPPPPDIASLYEANKPFDYEDTPPEERVEKDLRLLQTTMERPTKNLGMLKEVQHENILYPFSETREIPWEHPKTYGVFSSLLRTIKNVMFSAPAFFRTMPPAGGMAFAFLFFILHGYLAVMCTTFWVILAAFLFDIPAIAPLQAAVPSIALFTPVGLSLLLIAATSCTRIFLILFQKQQATFAFTFKLLSYAIAPLVLSVIPFIGPVAGLIWSFVILGTACHHSTGLSPVRSVITTIPTFLLVLGLFFLLFS